MFVPLLLTLLFGEALLLSQALKPALHSSDVMPKKFYVKPSNLPNIATAAFNMAARLGSGAFVSGYGVGLKKETVENENQYAVMNIAGFRIEENTKVVFDKRPTKFMLELYEFEGCPFCKKVREAVAILDLDVIFYPCPKGSSKHRAIVQEIGGKQQFPFLRDPNTGVDMYESDDIIAYLFDSYGPEDASIPSSLTGGFLTTLSCGLALTPRLGRGSKRRDTGTPPEKPLVYWGYEASPFCKVVREVLNELEIPHVQRTCARGSSKRQELLNKKGIFQVPFIEDPNNEQPDFNLFESTEIISYLEKRYGQ